MPDAKSSLRSLLTEAAELQAALEGAGNEQSRIAGTRLRDSVVRPLREALELITAGGAEGNPDSSRADNDGHQPSETSAVSDRVFDLARSATRLRVQRPDLVGLVEATAALQDVAINLADEP
ncbi:MAG: hypothetical protein ABSA91_02290, partial [Acidimicrobiales bacterium]